MKFSEFPYKRFDMEEVKKEYADLIESSKNAKSGEEQFEIHKKYYELISDIITTVRIGNFRHDIDTSDKFYAAEKEYLDEQLPIIEHLENARGSAGQPAAWTATAGRHARPAGWRGRWKNG